MEALLSQDLGHNTLHTSFQNLLTYPYLRSYIQDTDLPYKIVHYRNGYNLSSMRKDAPKHVLPKDY